MFDFQIKGRIAIVTMCRAPVNAINMAWLDNFHALLDRVDAEDELSAVHIRSDQRVFCAGMDLAHVKSLFNKEDGAASMAADVAKIQQLLARIESLSPVVIAELNGSALGGGLELALSCDLRIASQTAKLGLPETQLGLIPGAGGTQRLTQLCGRGVASRIILSGDLIDGATAERLGIVQWSFTPELMQSAVASIVARIGELSSPAVREAKKLIAAAHDPSRDGYREEREADRRLVDNADTRNRVVNFFSRNR